MHSDTPGQHEILPVAREGEGRPRFTPAYKVAVRLVKAQCVAYGHTWVTDHEFEIWLADHSRE
jgi:hypothetical protein